MGGKPVEVLVNVTGETAASTTGSLITHRPRQERFIALIIPRMVWALGFSLVLTAANWALFAFVLARPIWFLYLRAGGLGGSVAHVSGVAGGLAALIVIVVCCFPSVLSSLIFVAGFPMAYLLMAKKRVMTKAGQTLFELYRPEVAAKLGEAVKAAAVRLAVVEPPVRAIRARLHQHLPFVERMLFKRALKKVPQEDIMKLYKASRSSKEELDLAVAGVLDRVHIDVPSAAPRVLIFINAIVGGLVWLLWTTLVKYSGR